MARTLLRRRSFIAATAATAAGLLLPAVPASAGDIVTLDGFYNPDMSISPYGWFLNGMQLRIQGFMAPPLPASDKFFVLGHAPLAVCPSCKSEEDWPGNIAAVYSRYFITPTEIDASIVTSGVLQVGTYRDEQLGFVSQLRITDAVYAHG